MTVTRRGEITRPPDQPFAEAKAAAVERFERGYLRRILEKEGSVAAAARAAGIDRQLPPPAAHGLQSG